MGKVINVSATTNQINSNIKGEDVATILLAHDGGGTSVVDCSYSTLRIPELFPQTLLEIDGKKGSVRLDPEYKLVVHKNGKRRISDVRPPILPWAQPPWHNIQESVLLFQENYVECLRSANPAETSGHDNLETMELVEAAYASSKEKRIVNIEEIKY